MACLPTYKGVRYKSVSEIKTFLKNEVIETKPAKKTTPKKKKIVAKPKAPAIKKPAKKDNVYKSGTRSFEVNVVDGKLEITPVHGIKPPNKKQVADIKRQYLENNDFTKGKRADLTGVTDESQQTDAIESSQNAQEIAQEIERIRELNSETTENTQLTIEGAIASALAT